VSDEPRNLILFLGRFHALLVHLPIGALVLLGMLELLAKFTRWKDAAQNSRWILGFVFGTAAASAAGGWMLSWAGGYDSQLLEWHQTLAFALLAGCLLTLVLRQREWLRSYRVSLAATLLLLAVVSHLGGSITHGRRFLTRYAPRSIRGLLGLAVEQTRTPAASPPAQQPVFAWIIEPILQERCVACHGAEIHKADLRLDTLEGLLRGGQNGPVIKAGQAKDSPLFQRMVLPLEGDGHMPPEDQPQTSADEVALIKWWINAGAPATEKAGDLGPEPGIRRLLQTVSKRPEPAR
jgi:uncharacterized membrane protein